MADPLAGKRETINQSDTTALLWPYSSVSPVKVGDMFALRTCQVHITRVHRVRKAGEWCWRAEFDRLFPDRPWILGNRGEYVRDPQHGMRTREDAHATTLVLVEERDLCEPEGVSPYEIPHLPSTIAARERFEKLHRKDAEKRLERSLAGKVREVVARGHRAGVDLTDEVEIIQAAAERARLKLKHAELREVA